MIREDSWKPVHKYSFNKSGKSPYSVFIRYYGLSGTNLGNAYSLHLSLKEAEDFSPELIWSSKNRQDIGEVYVSSKTLEDLTQDQDKVIFASSSR